MPPMLPTRLPTPTMPPAPRRRSTAVPMLVGALGTALLLTACSDDGGSASGQSRSPSRPSSSADQSGSATASSAPSVARPRLAGTVATGLAVPWGVAFLPDGSALVAERDTEQVKRVTPDGTASAVGRVEGVEGSGEGGLLGLAVSPDFAEDSAVFAYFTAGAQNVIARLIFDGRQLSGQRRIFDGIPAGPIHNGGRIAFGPDGYLYVGTGESGNSGLAQQRGSLGGKILRITAEGEPAPGNPFPDSPVYSLGHRNVQGLAWDSRGQLWAAEFGQNTWDELNQVEAGENYGWPEVEGRARDDRYVDPVRQWRTSVASPSGIAVVEDSVFMAGLRGSRLWQIPIPDGKAGRPRALLRERFGRLRTVVAAPDGSLWVTTSNRDGRGSVREGDDRILRLTFGS